MLVLPVSVPREVSTICILNMMKQVINPVYLSSVYQKVIDFSDIEKQYQVIPAKANREILRQTFI